MFRFSVVACMLVSAACATAARKGAAPEELPPATEAIRLDELRADLFTLASDAMRGREAGTLDELRAAAWVAERARAAGLEPAGDDGTYLQFWPMRRIRMAGASVTLGGEPLALWRDVFVPTPADTTLDGSLVFVDAANPRAADGIDLRGKVVAAVVAPADSLPPRWVSLWPYRYVLTSVREQVTELAKRGAAAVVLVADSITESQLDRYAGAVWARGRYNLDSTGTDHLPPQPPVLVLRRRLLDAVRGGARLTA